MQQDRQSERQTEIIKSWHARRQIQRQADRGHRGIQREMDTHKSRLAGRERETGRALSEMPALIFWSADYKWVC